jgi:hypothetical protein
VIPPRYELKFWSSREQLDEFFACLTGLLTADPHSENNSYLVTSLYFDSTDYRFFFEKLEGLRHRFKIRLRRYGTDSGGFLELKEKRGRRIIKQRIKLNAGELASIANGDWAALNERCESSSAARLLHREVALSQAIPVIIIRYEREAHFFIDDSAIRITVDRQLSCLGSSLAHSFIDDDKILEPMFQPKLDQAAILEVKFSGPIPGVIASALRKSGLERRSISKYCLSIVKAQQLPANYRHLQDQLLLTFGN